MEHCENCTLSLVKVRDIFLTRLGRDTIKDINAYESEIIVDLIPGVDVSILDLISLRTDLMRDFRVIPSSDEGELGFAHGLLVFEIPLKAGS